MTLRKGLLTSVLILFVLVAARYAVAEPAPAKPGITIDLDHTNAVYACGDDAAFSISVTHAGQPVEAGGVYVIWTRDFRTEIEKGSVTLEQGHARLSRTLEQPGFLQCRVTFSPVEGDAVNRTVCAAFSPEQIEPGQPEPADFDAFWAASRKELDAIPLDAVVTPLPKESRSTYDAYKISLANIHGTRAWGFLTVPKGKAAPLLISVPGANLNSVYNQIDAPKRMFNQPFQGHMSGKSAYSSFANGPWLRGELGLGAAVAP